MPLMDEFKEERATLKNKPLKDKLSYYWDYYKWHVIVTVIIVVAATSYISSLVRQKDTALFAALINCADTTGNSEAYVAAFEAYAGINSAKETAIFDTSMTINSEYMDQFTKTSMEKMMAYLASRELDVIMSSEMIMEGYANNEIFMDLRKILTSEQIAKYEDNFYYIDQVVVNEKNAQNSAGNYNYIPNYPNPRHPETMEDPIPVGIYLTNTPTLMESFHFSGKDPVLAVAINTKRSEMVSLYIDYVLSK